MSNTGLWKKLINTSLSASRPSYLSAKNYVFFLGRQVTKDRGLEVSESTASENESFIVELPKLCDLLRKLKDDLRCDSEDFLEEFVSEPQNGVIVLLELLKTCHGRQSNQEKNKSVRHQERQHVLKKVLSDEYDSLLCLKYSVQFHKAIVSITEHYSGLSILASCIMSNFTKSRVVALEILGKVCDVCPESYTKILEAMSSVKLIFGESVRFKFLVSMLMGSGKTAQGFEKVTLQFLNTLLYRCPRPAERIRLQCELEEAGLNVDILEKKLEMKNTPLNDEVWKETRKWKDNYLDVQATIKENHTISSLNSNLRQEVALLRNAVASLEGDKIRLMQIESELKDKCEELEHELNIMKKEREELENTKTITKADGSDVVTTDSGRHSFQTEDENDRPENEEILIDVPTIRPPAGFRSPTEENVSVRRR
ncbi:formin-like protein 1 [Tachypleus tridentatus]|uniref:formin-like protein 1 n=1 Tax=Tachypleus tridentatus TaxID=6853 RepID=UPI003FD613DE